MEQHKSPSSKIIHLWLINLCKGGKNIQWRGETGQLHGKGLNRTFSNTKIKSKWIKELNIGLITLKILKNIGRTLFDINCNNNFLDPFPRVMESKWHLTELKCFEKTKPQAKQKDNL